MNEWLLAAVVAALIVLWVIIGRARRNAVLRRRAEIYATAEIRPGEDRRMVAIALRHNRSVQWVRERLAEGFLISRFGNFGPLLIPPPPPRPPSRES